MPTLYYAPGTCSLAVHIVLEWIGQPYEAVKVDYSDFAYKKINPAGAVPALDYGGARPLTQNAAILQYLAATHPAATLMDTRSSEEAAELERWSAFLTGDLHPAFFPVFLPGRYTVSKDPAALADVKSAGLALVKTKLALLNEHLTGRTRMVGDKRSIIDGYVTPMLNWAASMMPDTLQAFAAVASHRERMLADLAVHRVMMAEGLVKE